MWNCTSPSVINLFIDATRHCDEWQRASLNFKQTTFSGYNCTWKCAFRNVILFHNKWAERFGKFRFYFIIELSCWVTVLIFRLFLVILSYTSKKLSVSAISFHWTGKSLVGADPKNTVVLIVLRRAELVDLDFPFSIEFSKTHYS